jgi:hypothetical protein
LDKKKILPAGGLPICGGVRWGGRGGGGSLPCQIPWNSEIRNSKASNF